MESTVARDRLLLQPLLHQAIKSGNPQVSRKWTLAGAPTAVEFTPTTPTLSGLLVRDEDQEVACWLPDLCSSRQATGT
jgi:hypothetical protein